MIDLGGNNIPTVIKDSWSKMSNKAGFKKQLKFQNIWVAV